MKHPRRTPPLPVALLVALMFAFAACSSNDGSTDPGDDDTTPPAEFITGASSTYAVSGTTENAVEDSVSGATIIVTPGGAQTISVTPVSDGPELPFAGEMFQLDYTGSDPVTLRFATDGAEAEEVVLMHWEAIEGAAIDDATSNLGWFGVPPSGEGEGYVEFTVPLESSAAAKRAGIAATDTDNFSISKLKAGTGDFNHLRVMYQTVNQVIDTWIAALPADQQWPTRMKVEANPWTVMWTSGGNYYKSTTNAIFSPKVILFFNARAELPTIAHETGHYMCHSILGTARYDELYARFPKDFWGSSVDHDLGRYRPGRLEMFEDYPYVTQYLCLGELDQHDITSIAKYNNVRDLMDGVDPQQVDYPSLEGFSACMLASLLRTGTSIYSFVKVSGGLKADVPVVGASWGDVLTILARGPRDPNELRTYMQDYLDGSASNHAKLPAMFEPLGWSYHGSGTVVDKEGKPIADAHVQCISKVGLGEYRTPLGLQTDEDGKFIIDRLFPGTNFLRVFTNADKDSVDFDYTIDWSKPTNEAIALGTFTIERTTQVTPLEFDYNYVLTPGIRAQNPLHVVLEGDLTGPEGIFVYPQTSAGQLDIQSAAGAGQDIDIAVEVSYTLGNGTSWNTSLSQGDYGDATSARTVFSNARFKIIEYTGPNDTKSERTQNPGALTLHIPAPTAIGEYYRADIRLEWDYTQTYTKDSVTVGSTSDKAGVYFLHIWRDTMGFGWKIAGE